MSFKVGIKTQNDLEWVYNALRFASKEQAQAYAEDLKNRWTAVTEYTIVHSKDAPNR